ncbi:hypothetical protein HHI36_006641 [Cryptolaemus montrouzieri]|uniref:cGMP-dependent protein kinase n=1 Tax=Cryptolaemus montrouzieri TaxID=559131 RepID=A0ABD2NXZ9_9CUCU
MIKKIFSSSYSFHADRGVYRRKSAIHILPANDEDKEFKKSVRRISKSRDEEKKIRTAIEENEFISHVITDRRLEVILRTIYSQEVQAGDIIIQEGEIGSQLFISASGKFEVSTKAGYILDFDDIRVFGELALLYNEKRKATVRAVTKGRLWVLENRTFKEIVKRTEEEERMELVYFLSKVSTLNTVPTDTLNFVADLLNPRFFQTNTAIVREGDKGDAFYIIRAGAVRVETRNDGVVARLTKGQYFGELALIHEDVRKATVIVEAPGCECLILSRKHFIKHFGDVEDFRRISISTQFKELSIKNEDKYKNLNIQDFQKIKTIGAGGFGRVDLIHHKNDKNLIFALKYLKKYKCVLQEQRDHVMNEKNVQMKCYCPFIIRLYKTFKDDKYLYFLMEAQLGGDLWRLLYYKRRKPFEETEARFYVGCVVEAFQYLHERGIVYRDLKPENLLIADNGYVKLTDFGFAKIIVGKKTHSMVGTPDYMPPEIVLNKSHDRAVDCWTLGVFVFELVTLKTPFKAYSDRDTYNMILKGIDHCRFPHHLSTKCKHLIIRLCKSRSTDRLGYSKNGMMDVKNHSWFSHFDWESFRNMEMKAPYVPKFFDSLDLSNFPTYKADFENVPEEVSNWDEEF